MRTFLTKLFGTRRRPPSGGGRPLRYGARPYVEALEDRAVPAILSPSASVAANLGALGSPPSALLRIIPPHLPPIALDGPNLVPIVEHFSIDPHYTGDLGEVQEGCIPPGVHKVLKFDFIVRNVGNRDFVLPPLEELQRRGLVEYSNAHGHHHWHLKNFNVSELRNLATGRVVASKKQAFCVTDYEPFAPGAGPGHYNCNGISVGWQDRYRGDVGCQFIVLDGLPDGVYQLKATVNAVMNARHRHIFSETNYDDNTVTVNLRIQGNTVTVLHPLVPILPPGLPVG